LSPKFRELLVNQYRQHPNWSYQLHADNLAVLIEKVDARRRSFLERRRSKAARTRFGAARTGIG